MNMKVLILTWILLSLTVLAQGKCDKYEAFLKQVDKNYAELSRPSLLNYGKYTLSQRDTLKVSLYNVNGELVYQKYLGLLEEGTYIIKFFNPNCLGVYFVSTEIGNQPAYKKAIQITSEELPLKEVEIFTYSSSSLIEGVWKRSYSEKVIPEIQLYSGLNKIEYHYKYDLQVHFSKDFYKIISEITDVDNGGKETKTFEGKFIVIDKILKLYEDSKLNKVFQYKIEKDTLSISHLEIIDRKTGMIAVPIERNIYNTEIKLIGKYHK